MPTGVVVCRGCCCGSAEKRPQVDHATVLARLERAAVANPRMMTVRTTDCLGPCEHSDVIVVGPSPTGRRCGGRPVWFGLMDQHVLGTLLAWVADGGPGVAPIPDVLELYRVQRPRTQATADVSPQRS
jgi:hypothetical protein